MYSQREWWSAPRGEAGLGELEVRMVSDTTGAVATKYGVFKQNECVAFRLGTIYYPACLPFLLTLSDAITT